MLFFKLIHPIQEKRNNHPRAIQFPGNHYEENSLHINHLISKTSLALKEEKSTKMTHKIIKK